MSCIFCQIAQDEIASDIVYEDDQLIAFRDLNPQAPVHIIVIPREHISTLAAASAQHTQLLGQITLAAAEIARQEEIAQGGYRLVANVGPDGGQSVDHLHFHLLGGRQLHWPPG